MISDELYEQLKAWLIDATSDNPSRDVRCYGICWSVNDSDLIREMQAFWVEQDLSPTLPFNSDFQAYRSEKWDEVCHLNPRRLAWVRERIAEYDQTLAMYEEEKRT